MIDIDNTIAPNKKRKPGSMDASFTFARICKGHRAIGNAVTTELAAFASQACTTSAQRIRLIREYRNGFPALAKNRPGKGPAERRKPFLAR